MSKAQRSYNVESATVNFLDGALKDTDYESNLRKLLIEPDREIKMDIPFQKSNGKLETYRAFRVQHSDLMGPYKGGLRMHPSVCEEDFRALAMLMTLKLSLFELPFGGAKGGIRVDLTKLSRDEKERLIKSYVEELDCLLGAGEDIPAPDIGSGPEEMAMIAKAYQEQGLEEGLHVTGQPADSGGIEFRKCATGLGVAYVTQLASNKFLNKDKSITVAIQGFGNVGTATAEELYEKGYKIVSVSDETGAVYNKDVLDIPKLIKNFESKTSLKDTAEKLNQKFIDNEELLKLEVDVFIPAAREGLINKKNCKDIKASLIVEGANGPITPEAHKILLEKEKIIVPDILANAGGVIGSFFEWEAAHKETTEEPKQMKQRLEQMIKRVWEILIEETSKTENNDLRSLAYKKALKNLASSYEKRGYKLTS